MAAAEVVSTVPAATTLSEKTPHEEVKIAEETTAEETVAAPQVAASEDAVEVIKGAKETAAEGIVAGDVNSTTEEEAVSPIPPDPQAVAEEPKAREEPKVTPVEAAEPLAAEPVPAEAKQVAAEARDKNETKETVTEEEAAEPVKEGVKEQITAAGAPGVPEAAPVAPLAEEEKPATEVPVVKTEA